MRIRFSLGKDLKHRESSQSIVCMHTPISSASVGGIRHFVVQILSMDAILMGYWVADQMKNMVSNVMNYS